MNGLELIQDYTGSKQEVTKLSQVNDIVFHN